MAVDSKISSAHQDPLPLPAVRNVQEARQLSSSVTAAEAMAEAVVRVEVLGALSQVAILLV